MVTAAGTLTNIAAVSHYEKDPAPANNLDVSRGTAVPNPCATPPPGLVGWWPGENNANDLTGTNHGALANVTFAPGKVGQAFVLNGANASVNFGRRSPGIRWSLEAWVKVTALQSARRVILGCHADCRDWSILLNNSEFALNIGRGGCVAIIGSGVTAVTGLWYHVVGTCDGTNGSIYVNGALKSNGPVDLNYTGSSSGFLLGDSVCCDEYLAALVDEASLYDRALSAGEVFSLYDAQRSGKCTGAFAPVLALTPSTQGEYLLVWPDTASGFILERVDVLGGVWQRVDDQPVHANGQFTLNIDANGNASFYRLRKQQ